LIVHDALERIVSSSVYFQWLTPGTNIGTSVEGAVMISTHTFGGSIASPTTAATKNRISIFAWWCI
jgi:hypothetical protein